MSPPKPSEKTSCAPRQESSLAAASIASEIMCLSNGNFKQLDQTRGSARLNVTYCAGPFFTRGILLDIAAFKGVERPDKDYIVTIEATDSPGNPIAVR
jgi:hypothetical protein